MTSSRKQQMKGGEGMVRVIIERHCRPGKESELENLLVELRTKAMRQRGYVSGETLRSTEDPSRWLVLSTWLDADLWKIWESSPERDEMDRRIQPLLAGPAEISLFSFVWSACWSDAEAERWNTIAASATERTRE
jgi:heme-degrading monooxygenase HmoA